MTDPRQELERVVAQIIDPLAMSDSIDPDVLAERLEIRRKSVQILDAIYKACKEPTPEMLTRGRIALHEDRSGLTGVWQIMFPLALGRDE